ncbi:MAG: GNAT family N-acetyltransferase [Mesorhizobium sp.]
MVDMAESVGIGSAPRIGNTSSTIAAAGSLATALSDYLAFAAQTPTAPAQSPSWVSAWVDGRGDADIVLLDIAQRDARLYLPLEVNRAGPFCIATFLGGTHANGNFPPFEGSATITPDAIVEAVRRVRPDIDLLRLDRLTHKLGGHENPLAHLATGESPNVSLAVDLEGGFDALLTRTSGKRKRKKHRSQIRKFEAFGTYGKVEATTPSEVDRLLDAFFVLKSARFKQLGLKDVFATEGVKRAFRNLFTAALAVTPKPFALHALEVGGKIRAVTGSSRSGDRLICEFGAIADDELGFASPGEFLFFENIRQACEDGSAVYDFSVGDEHYKRLWCNIEERQFDVLLPVTAKGRVLAGMIGTASRVKRAIKSNDRLWTAVKRLRRVRATAPRDTGDDD